MLYEITKYVLIILILIFVLIGSILATVIYKPDFAFNLANNYQDYINLRKSIFLDAIKSPLFNVHDYSKSFFAVSYTHLTLPTSNSV